MKAINRLYQYIEYKGFKPTNFEREIGLSSGYLSKQKGRSADIGETIVIKINENCPELNLLWLLTGEGEMLKKNIEGDDVSFGGKDKKNEQHDKKKCHDAQNNFNEKNVHPLEKFNKKKNVHPLRENVHPICPPNSEIGEFNQVHSMASEESEPYEKIDLPTARRRELLRGGNAVQILELKDSIISTQKSYIASLEAQLSDIKQDVKELRKDLQEIKKANDCLIKELEKPPKNYAPAWGAAEKPTKR